MQPVKTRPEIAIRHSIPGRLRLGIKPIPVDSDQLIQGVYGHDGIELVTFNSTTGSLLITFDHQKVTPEEILLRAATAISLANKFSSVLIVKTPEETNITAPSLFAAATLGTALLAGPLGLKSPAKGILELAAGLSTAGAVAEHGLKEYYEKGYFDPEVVSLLYLVNAFFKGNILPAALFTWITSFGRHLFDPEPQSVVLRPVPSENESEAASFKIVVSKEKEKRKAHHLLTLLPSLLKYALGEDQGGGLIENFRTVSSLHDEIIHGLGTSRDGIPITFS